MGLTMEGRANPLCHVGNGFMSRPHKARCMEGAATMQEASYNTHTMHHTRRVVLTLPLVCTYTFYTPVYRTFHSTGGEGEILVMVR